MRGVVWDRKKKGERKTTILNEWVNLKHQSIVLFKWLIFIVTRASKKLNADTEGARLACASHSSILVPCHLERTLAQFGPFQPLMNWVFVVGAGRQPAWIHEGFQKIRGKKCGWVWRVWPTGGWEHLLWLIWLSGLCEANNGWDIWRVN